VIARVARALARPRALAWGAGAVVLIVGAALVLPRVFDDGSTRPVRVASEGTGGSSGAGGEGETTTPDGSGTVSPDPTTTRPGDRTSTSVGVVHSPVITTTTAPAAHTSTTADDRCRNNNGDSSCGAFRWASDPGSNAPLQFDVTSSPASPQVGQSVTYTVHVVDPDAAPVNNCGVDYDGGGGSGCAHTMECAANYGTWDVPPKQRGDATFTYTHTFTSAGQHSVTFSAESMQGQKTNGSCAAQPNPYASYGSKQVTTNVG
jgi:hypothetical protein